MVSGFAEFPEGSGRMKLHVDVLLPIPKPVLTISSLPPTFQSAFRIGECRQYHYELGSKAAVASSIY